LLLDAGPKECAEWRKVDKRVQLALRGEYRGPVESLVVGDDGARQPRRHDLVSRSCQMEVMRQYSSSAYAAPPDTAREHVQ
jgi:hypothetical protein